MHYGVLSVGIGFHGVHDVATGAAGASVMGMTGVVGLAAGVAGKGVDIMGATSLAMGSSGLMVSRWHSWMWSLACPLCPPVMTCTMYELLLASIWQWRGATGSWHHWGQSQYVWQWVGTSFCSLSVCNMQHSRRHVHQDVCDHLLQVGLCSVYTVASWCIMPIGTEVLQGSTDVHWWVYYGVLGGLIMNPNLGILYG